VILFALACVVGLYVLTKAADQFVIGAARLAALWQVPAVVIGAVIVGFGTSAPELLVSSLAAAQGDVALGIGNIVGSNIANISMILGVAALLVPLAISSRVLRREAPLSAAGVLLFAAVIWDGLSWIDGVVLATGMVGFLAWTLVSAARSRDEELIEEVAEYVETGDGAPRLPHEVLRTAAGLLLTLGGAQLLVWGATGAATELGISEGFIGLTLVAVGTSLPELVTSVAAARRGEDELIVGNLLGSNLFNSLAVGAAVTFLGPGPLPDATLVHRSLVMMVAFVLVALVFMVTRSEVTRREGVVLIAGYGLCVPLLAG
jgi:cation:H+ antiporter